MTLINATFQVLAVVGTDHHPFDRLVDMVDSWCGQLMDSGEPVRCHIQYGTSAPPRHVTGSDYLDKGKIARYISAADMVITHGGPSTILEVLHSGKRPLVMPRDPKHGEHVDEHQMRFARHMAAKDLVTLVDGPTDLNAALERLLAEGSDPSAAVQAMPDAADSARRLGVLVDQLLHAQAPVRRR